jgi:uncharacterized circularly permuted ATP-grasp superfamily protein
LIEHINNLSDKELLETQEAAEKALRQQGITFSVYGDKEAEEKILPFDILPRVIPANEWAAIEPGMKQRIKALNLFIDDVYNEQRILNDGVIPKDLVLSSECYLPQCRGISPPKKIWIHITGTDLVCIGFLGIVHWAVWVLLKIPDHLLGFGLGHLVAP